MDCPQGSGHQANVALHPGYRAMCLSCRWTWLPRPNNSIFLRIQIIRRLKRSAVKADVYWERVCLQSRRVPSKFKL